MRIENAMFRLELTETRENHITIKEDAQKESSVCLVTRHPPIPLTGLGNGNGPQLIKKKKYKITVNLFFRSRYFSSAEIKAQKQSVLV